MESRGEKVTRPCLRPWLQDPQLNCGELGTLHVLVPNGPATGPPYGPGQVGQPVVDGGESTPCGAQRLVGMTSKAAGPCRPPGLGEEVSQEPLLSSFLLYPSEKSRLAEPRSGPRGRAQAEPARLLIPSGKDNPNTFPPPTLPQVLSLEFLPDAADMKEGHKPLTWEEGLVGTFLSPLSLSFPSGSGVDSLSPPFLSG